MCDKIDRTRTPARATGFYLKGNEPAPMAMAIITAPCVCGKVMWGRVENGVISVRLEAHDVGADEIGKLEQDAARAWAAPAGSDRRVDCGASTGA